MPTIVGVKFKYAGKVLYFDPAGHEPVEGDHVVVTTERGEEFGEVVLAPKRWGPPRSPPVSSRCCARADDADRARAEKLAGREARRWRRSGVSSPVQARHEAHRHRDAL